MAIQQITLKNGEQFNGFWNCKKYNGVIYFNKSTDGTKAGINWKKSLKINLSDVKSILNVEIEETIINKPHTVESWMKEMEKSERIGA